MRPGRAHTTRTSYQDFILSTKPVLYVPMQGSVAIELVRGVKAATDTPAVGTGPFAGAGSRSFSASTADNEKIVIPNDASYKPGNGAITIAGWFNRTAAGDSTPVLYHDGSHVVCFASTTLPIGLTHRLAGTGAAFTTTQTFGATDGWHHIVFARNGNPTVAYIDGESAAGTAVNRTFTVATDGPCFGIAANGAGGGTTSDFAGDLAHWAVWNRVLSADEVRELYRQGRQAV